MHITAVPAAPGQARAVRDRTGATAAAPLPADAEVSGAEVSVDRVRAPGAGDGAVVHVYGGGFAPTGPGAERATARRLSKATGRLSKATGRPALRVDCRPAPAHPCPAVPDDALAARRSVLERGIPTPKAALVKELS
ncbi:alpha/beta hydrolase fold domain-containing protein [Streptomyces enissocaesilis]|uniref:Alpha/beta hydrolase fold-3 domain-containing protein n=1 Tax=Streptomyces enissocaesilis TaxID=332589 RepID=A0ABP6JCC5_9ACTN